MIESKDKGMFIHLAPWIAHLGTHLVRFLPFVCSSTELTTRYHIRPLPLTATTHNRREEESHLHLQSTRSSGRQALGDGRHW